MTKLPRLRVHWLWALLAVLVSPPVHAQAIQQADTVPKLEAPRAQHSSWFRREDALVAGAFGAAALAAVPADRYFAKLLQDTTAFNDPLVKLASTDVSFVGRPGLLIVSAGMYGAGRALHRDGLAHVGLHATEAILLGEVTDDVLKGVVGRERPKSDINHPYDFRPGRGFGNRNYRSLASAHTVSAFAFAATMTDETARHFPKATWCIGSRACVPPAWIVGALAYGGASVIGLTRMYNNEHWASDVLIGAGMGTLAGLTVSRYTHEHPSNALDRALLHVSVAPASRGGATVWVNLTR